MGFNERIERMTGPALGIVGGQTTVSGPIIGVRLWCSPGTPVFSTSYNWLVTTSPQ